jgi:hypothetical protein
MFGQPLLLVIVYTVVATGSLAATVALLLHRRGKVLENDVKGFWKESGGSGSGASAIVLCSVLFIPFVCLAAYFATDNSEDLIVQAPAGHARGWTHHDGVVHTFVQSAHVTTGRNSRTSYYSIAVTTSGAWVEIDKGYRVGDHIAYSCPLPDSTTAEESPWLGGCVESTTVVDAPKSAPRHLASPWWLLAGLGLDLMPVGACVWARPRVYRLSWDGETWEKV